MFDKNMKLVQHGHWEIDDDALENPMLMKMDPAPIAQHEGFVFVYLTNESNSEVYFDDFEIAIKESMVVQNTNYYPFGLQHSTSWTRPTDLKNNFLYNGGSELNEKTKNYETFYRHYDPAVGRFTAIDPKTSKYSSHTPYNYAFNDPVGLNDPLGDDAFDDLHARHGTAKRGNSSFMPQQAANNGLAFDGRGYARGHSVWSTPGYEYYDMKNALLNAVNGEAITINRHFENNGDGNWSESEFSVYNPWTGGEINVNSFDGITFLANQGARLASEGQLFFSSIQKSGNVEVYIWNKTHGKDVGHTAIRVGDDIYGYYPTDVDGDGVYTMNDLKNSPGEMHINSKEEFNAIYNGDNITAYTLNITAAQQQALINNLNNVANNPGFYSLSGNHCTSIAYSSLINSGINIVRPPTPGYGTGIGTIGINMSPHSFQWMLNHRVNSKYISGTRTFTAGN